LADAWNWWERYMRFAICATALICGFVLPGQPQVTRARDMHATTQTRQADWATCFLVNRILVDRLRD
jgi:hypothetical protein